MGGSGRLQRVAGAAGAAPAATDDDFGVPLANSGSHLGCTAAVAATRIVVLRLCSL